MRTKPHATIPELIRFANRVRAAGGGNAIDALFPAHPSDAKQCLIAQALNFNCLISQGEGEYPDGEDKWCIYVDDRDVAERIAAELRRKVKVTPRRGYRKYAVALPKRIGRAAEAYDAFNNHSYSLSQIDPMFLPYITKRKLYQVWRGLRNALHYREAAADPLSLAMNRALAAVEAEIERRKALNA